MEIKHHTRITIGQGGNQKGILMKYLEINKNRTYQNAWDAVKSVLRGNLIEINACTKKKKNSNK